MLDVQKFLTQVACQKGHSEKSDKETIALQYQWICMDPEGVQGVGTLPPTHPEQWQVAINFLRKTGTDPTCSTGSYGPLWNTLVNVDRTFWICPWWNFLYVQQRLRSAWRSNQLD